MVELVEDLEAQLETRDLAADAFHNISLGQTRVGICNFLEVLEGVSQVVNAEGHMSDSTITNQTYFTPAGCICMTDTRLTRVWWCWRACTRMHTLFMRSCDCGFYYKQH